MCDQTLHSQSFFSRKIHLAVEDEKCIPTESGRWCTSNEVLVRSDTLDIIENDELFACLGKEYVSNTISKRTALMKFNCKEITITDVIACIKAPQFNLLQKDNKWLLRLYECLLMKLDEVAASCDVLSEIPLWRLRDGTMVSRSDGGIFYGLDVPNEDHYNLHDIPLRFLHSDFQVPSLKQFFEFMNIQKASVAAVFNAIISDHYQIRCGVQLVVCV